MNPNETLTLLTEKQRKALMLKYVYGWPLRRIALRLGGSRASVNDLLRRAEQRLAITLPRRTRMRRSRATSLSTVFNY
jgi:DNA-directed RNA polymerase specialized sigma24 family protein